MVERRKRRSAELEEEEEHDASEALSDATAENDGPSQMSQPLVDARPAKVRVVTDNDGDEDYDEDMEEEEDAAAESAMTQQVEREKADEQQPANGIINYVVLKNFLCHSFLEVNFDGNVNFITGRNGSGKSAIMTAIIVCLGGKATTTGRGESLKDLVKTGTTQAIITVCLRNDGREAYNPEAYGKAIIIERTIRKEGAADYKICAGKPEKPGSRKFVAGTIVSRKKDELTNILDHFGIQIDNPVSVLNQDTSREFLNNAGPKQKYQFYMKATEMDKMCGDYAFISQQLEIIRATTDEKKEALSAMKKEVADLRQKYLDAEKVRDLAGQRDRLREELAWLHIAEMEERVEKEKKELAKSEARRNRQANELVNFDERLKTTDGAVKEIEEAIEGKTRSLVAQTTSQEQVRAESKKVRERMNQVSSAIADAKCALAAAKRQQTETEKRIHEVQTKNNKNVEGSRRQRMQKIESLEIKIEKLVNDLAELNRSKEEVEASLQQRQRDLEEAKNAFADADGDMRRLVSRIDTLHKQKQDALVRYGAHIPEIVKRIGAERGFKKQPLGPLGRHMKLTNPKWVRAVESLLRDLPSAFLVSCDHDLKLLRKIFEKVVPRNAKYPQVILDTHGDYMGGKFNVGNDRAPGNFTTVLDVLETDETAVYNLIVDRNAAKAVLFERRPDAADVMRRGPQHVDMALTIEGDRITVGAGNTMSHQSNKYDGPTRLGGDVDQDIANAEASRVAKAQEVSRLRAQREELESAVAKLTARLTELKRQISSTDAMHIKASRELAREKEVPEEPVMDTAVLQEELAQHRADMEKAMADVKELEAQQAAVREQMRPFDERSGVIKAAIDEITDEINKLKELCETRVREEKSARLERNKIEEKLRQSDKEIGALVARITEMEAELETNTAKTKEAFPDRVELSGKSRSAVEKEIATIERRIEAEEKSKGKHEDITREYRSKKEQYRKAKEQFGRMIDFATMLEEELDYRALTFKSFRKMTAAKAKIYFINLINKRNYSGKLDFKHNKGELEVKVNPTAGGDETREDTRGLSGGERSYSTICFVLSLWDALESPFRILDEFDVFMDMVNRRVSMDLLVSVAQDQCFRQFIFITPQGLNTVAEKHGVRIIRLQDPERNQATLNFGGGAQQMEA